MSLLIENMLEGQTFMASIEDNGFVIDILLVLEGKYISIGDRKRGFMPMLCARPVPTDARGMSPL